MAFKRITVRVTSELHRRLSQTAAKRRISLNRFVTEALDASTRQEESVAGSARLRELSALLTPVAEASGLTEEELLKHVREVRRRIWKERYQEATQAVNDKGA